LKKIGGNDSRISIRQLEIFRSIVNAGSFSKATSLTHLSQPTLSQTMANLERNLNTQLIIRAKKKTIGLTPAGEFWLVKSIEILNLVQAAQATHNSHFLENTLNINLGAPPSIQGRIEGLIAKIGVEIPSITSMHFARFEDSSKVAEALFSHKINIGILSNENISGQMETLKIINLYSEDRLWAVPRSVPTSDVIETLRTGKNINSHSALTKYVSTPALANWDVGTVNWYRDKLVYSEAYFKATTHFSAIQMALAGLASCHIPATLIANLPKSVKENLNFFDIGAVGRSICLAFPKHFSTNRTFMDFVGKCQNTLVQEYDLIRQETLSEFDLIAIK
jgi:DNA-binding transcriptional LysR family regulator